MSQSRSYRVGGLPDGRWMLAWTEFSSQLPLADANAELALTFQKVANSDAPVSGDIDTTVVRVLAGIWPHLVLGSIYQDGVQSGQIEAVELSFCVDLRAGDLGAHAASDRALELTGKRYPTLPKSKYPWAQPNSLLRILKAKEGKVLIPGAELLRAFTVVHSEIALALFAGQWEACRDRLVYFDECVVAGEEWRVALKKKLPDQAARAIGAMLFDDRARAAACSVYASVGSDDKRLPAELPLPNGRFTFTARCLAIYTDVWLVLEIVTADWPWRNPVDASFEARSGDSGPKAGVSAAPVASLDISIADTETVSSEEAPRGTLEPEVFSSRGVRWRNLPAVKLTPTPRRRVDDDKSYIVRPDGTADGTGFGNPSGLGLARAGYAAQATPGPACKRFDETVSMLEQFVGRGISQVHVIPRAGSSARCGNLDVWPFRLVVNQSRLEQARSWSNIATPNGPSRARSFLVCEVLPVNGDPVYWIEIEPKGTEAFCALLFRLAPGGRAETTIADAMRIAKEARGVWRQAELGKLAGACGARNWRHGDGGEAAAARALAAILSI